MADEIKPVDSIENAKPQNSNFDFENEVKLTLEFLSNPKAILNIDSASPKIGFHSEKEIPTKPIQVVVKYADSFVAENLEVAKQLNLDTISDKSGWSDRSNSALSGARLIVRGTGEGSKAISERLEITKIEVVNVVPKQKEMSPIRTSGGQWIVAADEPVVKKKLTIEEAEERYRQDQLDSGEIVERKLGKYQFSFNAQFSFQYWNNVDQVIEVTCPNEEQTVVKQNASVIDLRSFDIVLNNLTINGGVQLENNKTLKLLRQEIDALYAGEVVPTALSKIERHMLGIRKAIEGKKVGMFTTSLEIDGVVVAKSPFSAHLVRVNEVLTPAKDFLIKDVARPKNKKIQ